MGRATRHSFCSIFLLLRSQSTTEFQEKGHSLTWWSSPGPVARSHAVHTGGAPSESSARWQQVWHLFWEALFHMRATKDPLAHNELFGSRKRLPALSLGTFTHAEGRDRRQPERTVRRSAGRHPEGRDRPRRPQAPSLALCRRQGRLAQHARGGEPSAETLGRLSHDATALPDAGSGLARWPRTLPPKPALSCSGHASGPPGGGRRRADPAGLSGAVRMRGSPRHALRRCACAPPRGTLGDVVVAGRAARPRRP